jgi:hypothetical protein
MCITSESLKTTTSCTGCLACACKLKQWLLQADLQNWICQVEWKQRPLAVVLDEWHMCHRVETLTAWSCTTCLKKTTSCTGCLACACKLKHRLLDGDVQKWTCQVQLKPHCLKSHWMYGTCVHELKHWLLEAVLHVYHKPEPKELYKLHWMSGRCF